MRLRSGSVVGHGHPLLLVALLILVPPIVVLLGQGGVIAALTFIEVTNGLGFVTEVGLDCLLTGVLLGGDVQELLHCARDLMAKCMDECLASRAADEGVDDVSIGDAGELIALLRETLDVLPEGLVGPLPAVAKIP
jgi:hypothetical protein